MDIVRSLRNGSHDVAQKDDSASVPPDEWRDHFAGLLGKTLPPDQTREDRNDFVTNNLNQFKVPELDTPRVETEIKETTRIKI